ncbi:granulocyte colony-stimulating factor receptor [Bufo bufo]|uniref:granulocyte colony-stimulating factor receptor n=1 Tax=Bufo bufo TaxID=8384 RepID=UPI001ABE49FB|nr:granulocyte colony-stimulating factor receptor [Bufo bufo]XP_040280350.1 granulocyte colony-stimulating factor receptor [Bufo bufo]
MYNDKGVPLVLLLLFAAQGVQSCQITATSSVIQIGSPLSASCDCFHLSGKSEVIWKLDDNFVPCSGSSNVQANNCSVYFQSFDKTSGLLQCYINSSDGLQLMDQINIKAGYLPTPPTNVSCLMNIPKNIVKCIWQHQKDSLLEETVTLSAFRSKDNCSTPAGIGYVCNPAKEEHFCIIPRKYFDNYKELAVQVTVQNKIGSAASSLLCLIPLREVKLEPIEIKDAIPHKDCVTLQWTYAKKESFLTDMRCQLQYKKATEKEWTGPAEIPINVKTMDQCGLLSDEKYDFQIRCIRKNLTGQWSDWGPITSVTTLESVPTVKLETWWRLLESTHEMPLKIQLMWKKLEKNKANAEHLWYIVRNSSDPRQADTILCNTTVLNCTISMPPEKKSVFIWAHNKAGASPETEIFLTRNGAPVSKMQVSSDGDYSLQVTWDPQASANGYLLEWYKSLELPDCEIFWKTEQKAGRSSVLHDIQPFQKYTVRLYPLYNDSTGMARETEVYLKEGAPDFSPKITLLTVSKSQATVQWKPIPEQRCNGFITNYTVFWIDTSGREHSSSLNYSTTNYNITNLLPSTTYQVFLRSSTSGGSVNGTVIVLRTAPLDNEDINMMLIIFILFGFLVIIFMIITCFMKQERVKNLLCPIVPDPANSQMGKWASFLEETPKMTFAISDVSQIITSELNIVEGCQVKNPPQVKDKSFEDYGHASNKQSSCFTEDLNKLRYYVNVDTVQYAKVITEGYREQSPPTSVYVRSDSTQPLLCDASPSPQNYENTWFHFCSHEDSVFLMEEENMKDFPLLKALQLCED